MKKFFLFAAVLAAFTLTSCGGSESSVPDGNSQATSIDPNDPNQAPPQMQETSVVEENVSTPAEQTSPEGQASANQHPPIIDTIVGLNKKGVAMCAPFFITNYG